MRNRPLSTDEVRALLTYKADTITEALESFGTALFQETTKRSERVDAKAGLLIGYAAGMTAFLLKETGWLQGIALGNRIALAILLAVSGMLGFGVLVVRSHTWFSDRDWFKKESFDSADDLKRYYLVVLHQVLTDLDESNQRKARWLQWGQVFLGLSFMSLLLAVAQKISH
jgi:hypothetical protein